jgi:hypothetical protein
MLTQSPEVKHMGRLLTAAVLAFTICSLSGSARADETDKLTNFTFSKMVQLPGMVLEPGQYRFAIGDPDEGRSVVKVTNADGTKQIAFLMTLPNELRDPVKDPLILFGETPAGQPDAIKAWVYPGERIGYEFIYPHDQAVTLAKRYHTSVLSKSGDKIDRVNESGDVKAR